MLVFIFSNMRLMERAASMFEAEELDVAEIFPHASAPSPTAEAAGTITQSPNDSPGAGTSAGSN